MKSFGRWPTAISGALCFFLLESGQAQVTVMDSQTKEEKSVPVRDLVTPNEGRDALMKFLPEPAAKNRRLKDAIWDIFLTGAVPNLLPHEEETKVRRKKAAEAVAAIDEEIK